MPAAENEIARRAEETHAQRVAHALDGVSPACWAWPLPPRVLVDEHDAESAAMEILTLWQDGRCAVCAQGGWLVIDHDHGTGLVRGWLCRRCNVQEGIWGDRDHLFGRYRRRPPTLILGLTLRYLNPITGEYDPGLNAVRSSFDPWGKDNAAQGIGL